MTTVQLNDGHHLPPIGFGTYKATEKEGVEAVKTALKEGYRLIDTAAKYENEGAVGKGIAQSNVSREEVIVTSKVWREELGYDQTKNALQYSLKKLKLDYIDLYLIHWPANEKNFDNWEAVNADTWRALEELQQAGLIKSIGVSNFWPKHLDELYKTATVPPAVNQIEFHPGYWQSEVLEYCRSKNIAVEAWSPLARGKVFENDIIQSIANKHNKSVAQICLRWIVQHGVIPIPKSSTAERIKENIHIFDFELTDQQMNQINNLPEMGFSGELPAIWPDKVTT